MIVCYLLLKIVEDIHIIDRQLTDEIKTWLSYLIPYRFIKVKILFRISCT